MSHHQYDGSVRQVGVNTSAAPREQQKAYSRMKVGAGKGDLMRNCWSTDFRNNYDQINWRKQKTTHERD